MAISKKVKVNTKQCEKVGEVLKKLQFRPSFYKREFLAFKGTEEAKIRIYLYTSAICHQTHALINKKKNLKGWDYIEYVFLNLARKKSKLLEPRYLAKLSVKELSEKLKFLFSNNGNPDDCTLDRLNERARFLIEIGKILQEKYSSKAINLIRASNGLLVNNGKGLYELLDQLESYSDPFKKKSTLFIKFLIDAGLLRIKDPQNFVPIMDYHMQRVLLRMGCVEILDKKLKEKLLKKEKIKSDEEIRNACIETIIIMSKISGYNVIRMNDFFWSLGRSCCREKTLCFDKECSRNPCTFNLIVKLDSHDRCVFEKVCKGSINEEYRNYWQPIVKTHYY